MLIPDLTRLYLRVQCGYIPQPCDDLTFDTRYRASLHKRFDNILPHLPFVADRSIDIGGGMSGIGLMLHAHYGPHLAHHVVDGLLDDPIVAKHAETFSSAPALSEFYYANGVQVTAIPPSTKSFGPGKYDIVTSFAAWGFHIPPNVYLSRVKEVLADEATVIIDVRRGRHDWVEEFQDAFGQGAVVFELPKLVRYVWHV